MKRSLRQLKTLPGDGYQVQEVRDGVVLLQRNGPVQPAAEKQLNQLLAEAKQR